MTANSLIAAALRLIGVIRTGQTASPSEIADSLDGLNNLIDNWNTERLNILSIGSASYPLVSATASYSIGTGEIFNAPRPVQIEKAFTRVTNSGGLGPDANIDFKLDLMSEADYDGIKDKGSYSEIPRSLYNDRAVPYSTLYCFPTPVFTSAITVSLVLHTWNRSEERRVGKE